MKRLTMMRPLIAALAFASGSALNAADITIVVDGKPNAVIVAAAETNAIQAAADIQRYIEKMSGARLPVVSEAEAAAGGLPVTLAVGKAVRAL